MPPQRHGARRAAGRVVLAGAAVALAAPTPAMAAFPGANGALAFGWYERQEDELGHRPSTLKHSIDVARPGGQGRSSLRACIEVDGQPGSGDCSIEYFSPAWAPGGKRLAFDAGARIAVMRSDRSRFRLLPQVTADDGEPSWSPDGGRLVISGAETAGGRRDLHVLDLATGDARPLTEGGRSPSWSSRNRIAFTKGGSSMRPGTGAVHVIRPDAGGLRRLVRQASDPSWSPGGTRFVVVRPRRRLTALWVVRADGTGLRRMVTPGAGDPRAPCWSPDGKQIAYTGFEGNLVAQRLRDRRIREVAPGGYSAESSFGANSPDWQPLPRR
jgi:dipeptidyl aminopeptidase/acylaminoacyl peptidase